MKTEVLLSSCRSFMFQAALLEHASRGAKGYCPKFRMMSCSVSTSVS